MLVIGSKITISRMISDIISSKLGLMIKNLLIIEHKVKINSIIKLYVKEL